jgi:predicted GH43/DUF377 family glycosyl hydrolase
VPENVVTVKATLSKLNHDPIISSLSLLDSNSAELFIDQIPVGQWNLVVEAFDSQNLVVFSGETVLDIVAGEITTVSLTLAPTGNGTGSIYLFVNWGDENKFIDFPQNPIVTKQHGSNDYYGVRGAFVLEFDSTFYMWYFTLSDHGKMYLNLATSANGLAWDNYQNNPVLTPGEYGSWDDLRIAMPVVIHDGNIFKLYYSGFRNPNGQWSIGLATSVDGKNWEKYGSPVLSGSAQTSDYKLTPNDIIKKDGTYYLYYSGKNAEYDHTNLVASSTDGINWTKLGELSFNQPQAWEANFIGKISIVKNGSHYKMVYLSIDQSHVAGFGEAFSEDGIEWTKNPHNPIFTSQMTVNNYQLIGDPFLLQNINECRIYYSGYISNIGSINVARKFTN